jgi:hypothetical protein
MCALTYRRIEEIQDIPVLEEGSQPQPRTVAPQATPKGEYKVLASLPRPRPLKPQNDDDDISRYSRVQIIDTSFQIQKAGESKIVAGVAKARRTTSHGQAVRPQSQRRPGQRPTSSRRPHPPFVEVPEDITIWTEISTLSTLIDQHAEDFYSVNQDYVRRIMVETIISKILEGSGNGIALTLSPKSTFMLTFFGTIAAAVSGELSDQLQDYAQESAGPARNTQLFRLCERAVTIQSMIKRHPSRWTFGGWDAKSGSMSFPSVFRDGTELGMPVNLSSLPKGSIWN